MKRFFTILITTAASFIILPGCLSVFIDETGKIDETRLTQITSWVNSASQTTASVYATNETRRNSLLIFAEGIDLIVAAEDYEPEILLITLNDYLVDRGKENFQEISNVTLKTILSLYRSFYKSNQSDNKKLSNEVYRRFLVAMQTGIYTALEFGDSEEIEIQTTVLPEDLTVILK